MTPGEYHPSETQAHAFTAGQYQKPAGIARYQSPADEELLFQFRKGDDTAFKTLFNSYYKPVLVFASRILGDTCIAEDIVAEAFYSLYHHRLRFNSLSHICSFLFLTARNASLDHIKTSRRRQASLRELARTASGFHELKLQSEEITFARLLEQIDQLPAQCARVCRLILFTNKKTHEIAAIMRTSTKTVLNQKLKAIKLLKKAIEKAR